MPAANASSRFAGHVRSARMRALMAVVSACRQNWSILKTLRDFRTDLRFQAEAEDRHARDLQADAHDRLVDRR